MKLAAEMTRFKIIHSCICDKGTTDIERLEAKISTLQSSVIVFQNVLKDYDVILSLYNRSAELNKKYLKELNKKKR